MCILHWDRQLPGPPLLSEQHCPEKPEWKNIRVCLGDVTACAGCLDCVFSYSLKVSVTSSACFKLCISLLRIAIL